MGCRVFEAQAPFAILAAIWLDLWIFDFNLLAKMLCFCSAATAFGSICVSGYSLLAAFKHMKKTAGTLRSMLGGPTPPNTPRPCARLNRVKPSMATPQEVGEQVYAALVREVLSSRLA